MEFVLLYKCKFIIIQHVLGGRPLAVMTWPTFGLFVQNSLWNSFTLCFYLWCIKWSTRDRKAVLHFGGHSSYIKDSLDPPLYQGLSTDRFGSFSPKSYDTPGPTFLNSILVITVVGTMIMTITIITGNHKNWKHRTAEEAWEAVKEEIGRKCFEIVRKEA